MSKLVKGWRYPKFWIDGKQLNGGNDSWKNSSNETLSFFEWGAIEPNEQNCLIVGSRGKMNDKSCNRKYNFFCELV